MDTKPGKLFNLSKLLRTIKDFWINQKSKSLTRKRILQIELELRNGIRSEIWLRRNITPICTNMLRWATLRWQVLV